MEDKFRPFIPGALKPVLVAKRLAGRADDEQIKVASARDLAQDLAWVEPCNVALIEAYVSVVGAISPAGLCSTSTAAENIERG